MFGTVKMIILSWLAVSQVDVMQSAPILFIHGATQLILFTVILRFGCIAVDFRARCIIIFQVQVSFPYSCVFALHSYIFEWAGRRSGNHGVRDIDLRSLVIVPSQIINALHFIIIVIVINTIIIVIILINIIFVGIIIIMVFIRVCQNLLGTW